MLSGWLLHNTGQFRKAARIPYPNAYASAEKAAADPKAYAFNCAQRAQTNFVEQYPSFLVGLMVSGLQYPRSAAALGMAWIVSRVVYTIGYTTSQRGKGDGGAGRRPGSLLGFVAMLGLYGLAIGTSFNALMGALGKW